jgi:transglutaminase-like putative cysteine protease
MTTYRTSEAEALAKVDAPELDLLGNTLVSVDRPLPNAHATKQVRYRVHLNGGDPAGVFVTGPTQQVKSVDAHTAEVTVYAIRPREAGGNSAAPADSPSDADRRPNNIIQSDDPDVVAQAKQAVGADTDPWRVAVDLERYVNRVITKKDYSQAFATAAEVAKSHEGDCTEHAVFLAALARARGIPARAAMGLVYAHVQGKGGFLYHMWTEVYIDGRWTAIDGTLAQGGIGAAHLKLAQSNFSDASAYSAFLPVAQVVGRLTIEILDSK